MSNEVQNPTSCQTVVSSSHSEIEFHIHKRKQERDRILSCWNEIEKLKSVVPRFSFVEL
jgi:hypothetical protein